MANQAARAGDINTTGGAIFSAVSDDVIINGRPAASIGSLVLPHAPKKYPHGAPTKIITGSPTVLVNGKPMAFLGSTTTCGHPIVTGSADVVVGIGDISTSVIEANPYTAAAQAAIIRSAGPDAVNPAESPPNPPLTDIVSCTDFGYPLTDADYEKQVSPSWKLKHFSKNAVWAHTIKDQRGLKENEIACNIKILAQTLEKLKAQFPGFNINSGFRQGNGTSCHELGYAADCQWPGISKQDLLIRCQWAATNLEHYQIIFEVPPGSGGWLHFSARPGKASKPEVTWKGGGYDAGFNL